MVIGDMQTCISFWKFINVAAKNGAPLKFLNSYSGVFLINREQLLKTCPIIKSPKKVEGNIGAFSNCSLNATVLLDECVHRSLEMESWKVGSEVFENLGFNS